MKIKSVKIQGFRAFEKEENSTFDFTDSNGEVVDFTSVYAPNGYGKTSFYDAVEWGITHQIQRFDRMDDFNNMRKENDHPLLLNNSSKTGKVQIETTTENFENIINNRKVYKKAKAENDYFQSQILSQDLIDTFIKEDRAEKRYEKFLEIDSRLKQYDTAYKKILRLLDYIDEKVTDTNKKISNHSKSLQTEIDFELEFKKFDEINKSIHFLSSNQETIEQIQKETFNRTFHDIITSQVKSRIYSLTNELNAIKEKIAKIRQSREGNPNEHNNIGLTKYIDSKNKLQALETKIKFVKNIIASFEQRDSAKISMENAEKKLIQEQQDKTVLLEIEKKTDTYLALFREIGDHEKSITAFRDSNLKLEKENIDLSSKATQLKNEIEQLQKLLNGQNKLIAELPTQKSSLASVTELIQTLNSELASVTDKIIENEKIKEERNIKISQFDYYENLIDQDLDLLLDYKDIADQKKVIENLIALKVKKSESETELNQFKEKEIQQNRLNTELKSYVTQGLEIISKNQSSECPLCTKQYDSFTELSDKILSNKALDNQLKEIIEKRLDIESKIIQFTEDIESAKENLRQFFKNLKAPLKLESQKALKEINKLLQQRDEKNAAINIAQEKQNEHFRFFNNESDITIFEKNVSENCTQLYKQIDELNGKYNSTNSLINEKNLLLKRNIEEIEILRSQIYKIAALKEFTEVADYFKEKLNSTKVDKVLLDEYKNHLGQDIKKSEKYLVNQKSLLVELDKKVSNYKLDEQISIIDEASNQKEELVQACENFESLINTEFGLQLKEKDVQELGPEFDKLIEGEKKKQGVIEKKLEHYNIIEILKDDCLAATVSQDIQHKINDLKRTIAKYDLAKSKLTEEKNNLVSYLTTTINKFFYTSLINSIYKKIDPHPDYNSIEFNCEFGDNKPRLQIYTTKHDENGKEIKSVPALYFSTAQINILSLSIFLARSLKTINPITKRSVDCIFIDDPIQSMDSINILSFIDLFRGIIVSLGKQLIVSTHEENFHLLLQKKIPKHIFKANYIEFETFGKLKQVST